MGDPEEVTRIEPEPGWFCRVDQLGNVVRERQREPGDEPEGQELLVPGEPGSVLSLAWNGQVWIVLRVRAR